jgi:hypothetical protein
MDINAILQGVQCSCGKHHSCPIEKIYVERQSLKYDAQLVWRTIVTIAGVIAGKKDFKDQPELAEAKRRLADEERMQEERHEEI